MTLPAEDADPPRHPDIERGLPKLSTSLLELMAPVLDLFPEEAAAPLLPQLLSIAWIAWNAGAPEGAISPSVAASWDAAMGTARPGMRADFGELIRRRREVFGHDPRVAGEPQVVGIGSARRIRVTTLDTPALRAWLADPNRADLRAGLAPPFAEFVRANGLDHRFVELGLPRAGSSSASWRHSVAHVRWRGEEADWEVPALATLFRGDARAPDAHAMARYPERYVLLFVALETTVLAVAVAERREPTDAEVSEAYSEVRRGRTGHRSSFLRDALRQRAALELALRPYSADEFDASMRQLERSVRRHDEGAASRGYVRFLGEQFAGARVAAYE